MAGIFTSVLATVPSPGTPVVFGSATTEFNTALVTPQRADGTRNIQPVRMIPGENEIYPDGYAEIRAPLAGRFNLSQFSVDANWADDGLLLLYCLADPKAFNDVEAKAERAMMKYVRTIAATLDDCSITTGISDDERTQDNISCHVSGCAETVHNTGLWTAQCHITIRTRVKREDALIRHGLRTAYVRDLFMDPEAPSVLSALEETFTAQPRSIRDRTTENRLDGEFWVTEFRFTMNVCGSNLS